MKKVVALVVTILLFAGCGPAKPAPDANAPLSRAQFVVLLADAMLEINPNLPEAKGPFEGVSVPPEAQQAVRIFLANGIVRGHLPKPGTGKNFYGQPIRQGEAADMVREALIHFQGTLAVQHEPEINIANPDAYLTEAEARQMLSQFATKIKADPWTPKD